MGSQKLDTTWWLNHYSCSEIRFLWKHIFKHYEKYRRNRKTESCLDHCYKLPLVSRFYILSMRSFKSSVTKLMSTVIYNNSQKEKQKWRWTQEQQKAEATAQPCSAALGKGSRLITTALSDLWLSPESGSKQGLSLVPFTCLSLLTASSVFISCWKNLLWCLSHKIIFPPTTCCWPRKTTAQTLQFNSP